MDARGIGVAGATVELVPLPDRAGTGRLQLAGRPAPEPSAVELSQDDGRFVVAVPAPGMWRLVVRSGAHVPADLLLRPLVEAQDVGNVELMDGERQDLVVLDSEGRGVEGLRLRVRESFVERRSAGPFSWRTAERTVETSETGHASLLRAPGGEAWVAAVSGDRFVHGRLGPERETVSLTLEPLRPARVVNAEGRPVADAVGSFHQPSLAFGRTGSEGGILVPHRDEEGPALFFATAEGGVAGRVEMGAGDELVVRLGPTVAADGQVIDALSGRGVYGAIVWTWHTYRETGRDGGFRLRLPVGDQIRVSAPGYAPAVVRRDHLAGDLTVDLLPVVFREGQIVDVDGVGIEGAETGAGASVRLPPSGSRPSWDQRLLGLTLHSGAEGRFRLSGMVPSAAYEIDVKRSGYASSRVISPPIEPGQTVDDLRIVLRPASRVLGRLLDTDRQPVADAAVGMVPEANYNYRRGRGRAARTDREGRFELLDLPGGTHRFAAEAPGLAHRVIVGIDIPEDGSDVDLGSIVLSPALSLEGRVLDGEGAAVKGARVQTEVRRWPDLASESSGRKSETDEEGRFTLVELSPTDVLTLDVAKEGYRKLEVPNVRVEGGVPLELVLLPGLELRGRVIDAGQRPVGEAAVTLTRWSRHSGRSSETAEADADGRFVFGSQAPGGFELLGRSQDGLAGSLEGELKQGMGEKVLVLRRAATITGRLLDPEGRGVAYGRISLEPHQAGEVDTQPSLAKRVHVTSEAEGAFEIAGIEAGSYKLSASHADFAPLTEQLEVAAGASEHLELRFPDRLLTIPGRVVDESGRGVADARMHYYEGKVFTGGSNPGHAVSTAEGDFELRILKPGPHTLWVNHPAFARKFVELEVAEDGEPVIVTLERGVVLTGRLLGLEPHEALRATVRAQSREGPPSMIGTVDSEGRYRVLGLRPGEWNVWANVADSSRMARDTIRVSGFDGELVLDLEFPAGHLLSGLVILDGRPLSTANVLLHCEGVGELAGRTGAEGTFTFEAVPTGDCWIEVRDRESQVVSGQKAVEVTGDQELVIEIQTRWLAGNVTRASDLEPVAGAEVELAEPGGYRIWQSVTTNVLGGFSFRVAAGKTATLRVTAEGYSAAEQRIDTTAGASDLQIVLRPAVPVVLMTLTKDGEVPDQVSLAARQGMGSTVVNVSRTFHPDRDGRILVDNLGAGRWELRLRDENGRWAKVVIEVPGAGVHEVVLEFEEQR